MKTSIKAQVVIEVKTDKYEIFGHSNPKAQEALTLQNVRTEIELGNYELEWINSELSTETEPTLIIKII